MPKPTDDLSPVPVPPQPTDLPFGLGWRDVAPCLPAFGRPGSAWLSHRKRGLHQADRSRILTLSYVRVDGTPAERTLFFKHNSDRTTHAEEKCRFLMSRGAPVASLLRTISRGSAEILVIAFLPVIGTGADEAGALLELIATINSVGDPPVDLFRPRPGTPGYADRIRDILTRLAKHASTPVPIDPHRWMQAYRRAADLALSGPAALNHNELSFQQVGRTRADGHGDLVVFDLETMALMPAYTDIAGILHRLTAQTGHPERVLFERYLAALARHRGRLLDSDREWRAMLVTRIVRSAESLPWIVAMAADPDVTETPAQLATMLHRDLTDLELI